MGTSACPSPYSLEVFYDAEIQRALAGDSNITLHNFLLGWDEKNGCQREYMDRPAPVEYWYCIKCHRVYEVQAIPSGRWLRVYNKVDDAPSPVSFNEWTRIHVMFDSETDAAMEESDILLSDYLRQHDSILYYLSPDEKIVHAVDKATAKVLFSYTLEDAWSPSAEE